MLGWRMRLSLIALLLLFFLLVGLGARFYTEYIWFDQLGFGAVYRLRLSAGWLLGIGVGLVTWAWLMSQYRIAYRLSDAGGRPKKSPLPVMLVGYVISIAGGLLAGFIAAPFWLTLLRYLHAVPFGVTDPLFERDVGFYVFTLPVLEAVQDGTLALLAGAGILAGLIYFLRGAIGSDRQTVRLGRSARQHLFFLAGLVLVNLAWGYWLDRFELLYSVRGAVFGAGYSDVKAQLPAFWIMLVLALGVAVTLFVGIWQRGWFYPAVALGLFVFSHLLVAELYPEVVQRVTVEPNELVRETPYIEQNIRYTQLAYGLDRVKQRDYYPPAGSRLALPQVERRYASTLRNIRLWDWRPLLQTYREIQEIRFYYNFSDVDIDRYRIQGTYRQVMLSPRELAFSQVAPESQTWVNQVFKYTHGYGLCLSPVDEITGEGLPRLWIRDIPPSSVAGIQVKRPEIYYGEQTDHYVMVKTSTEEFDYPSGDENRYTFYEGQGGVPIGSWWRRLLFAVKFRNPKILLTGYLTSDSRILFHRRIQDRVQHLMPFLRYDADPYLVVEEGRLFWIIDAYTTTDHYPYAEPVVGEGGINYIRNAVKVVIDAYDGRLTFYLVDESDPLIQTDAAVFPGLFRDGASMPEGIRAHLRVPVELFAIQAGMYATYHMTNPQVFYNKEDQWTIPFELYSGTEQPMDPYYVITDLPGETEAGPDGEFVLMQPFTPRAKNNMIAWMAARCDGPAYGELVVYRFPKQRLVFGPRQIEARIDQDPDISQLLTLWSQRGSQVIRGNLLVLPLEDLLLYVEPLFLQAEQGRLPQLKRVTVVVGDRLVMAETVPAALAQILTGDTITPAAVTAENGLLQSPDNPTLEDLVTAVQRHYEQARASLRAEDWAAYGRAMGRLQEAINQLVEVSKGVKE